MVTERGDEDASSDFQVDEVERFVADTRIEDAARARGRERWLRQLAAEASTVDGICRDLAERAEFVLVSTVAGTRHQGTFGELGTDFVTVRTPRTTVFVPFTAVFSIEARGGEPGQRPAGEGVALADVVAELALERPVVRVRSPAGDTLVGELRHGGRDIAAIRTGDGGRRTVYVRLSSLAELSVLSG